MLSPRIKIGYLAAVAVVAFSLRDLVSVGAVLALQIAVWFAARLPGRAFFRSVRRLLPLFFFVTLSFSLFGPKGDDDPYLLTLPIRLSSAGLEEGCLMVLRMSAVMLASQIVQRTGKPNDFAAGLRSVLLPQSVAIVVDTTLRLVGDGAPKRPGRGRRRRNAPTDAEGEPRYRPTSRDGEEHGRFPVRRLLRGDVGFLGARVRRAFSVSVREIATRHPHLSEERARELGVLSGIALTVMGLKMLRIAPGLPFAPGHKSVVLLPLYILAASLTRGRWSGTVLGASVGLLSFAFGGGRHGIFEVFKHIAPGIIVDVFSPWLRARRGGGSVSRYAFVGSVAAVGRFATTVVIVLLMGAPPEFFAMTSPLAIVHVGFGAVSGLVTLALIRWFEAQPVTADGAERGDEGRVSPPAESER